MKQDIQNAKMFWFRQRKVHAVVLQTEDLLYFVGQTMLWNGATSLTPGEDLAHLTPGKTYKEPAKLFKFPDKVRLLSNHLGFHHFLPLATRNMSINAQTPQRRAGEGAKIQTHLFNNIYSQKATLFKQALHLGVGLQ